jgi:pSer/pThr/pTyr-binding forkhead associated (FHA) protein
MLVLTLTLLHPNKTLPIQSWTFETETIIRIGRATDNDVVLFSTVVSRYHLELRRQQEGWEVVNLGANGTFEVKLDAEGAFVESKPLQKISAADGMVVRLASSGPKIQISYSA